MKNAITLIFCSLFAIPSFAASLACEYSPSKDFNYSGIADNSIQKAVKNLTTDCDKIENTYGAHDKWLISFNERCSALCKDRLGESSIDGGQCRKACGKAAINSALISRAYFRGLDEGKQSCTPESTDAAIPKAVK
jgi:hypothetical protein